VFTIPTYKVAFLDTLMVTMEIALTIVLVSASLILVLVTSLQNRHAKEITLGTSGCVAYTTALYVPGGGTACDIFSELYQAQYLDCGSDYPDYNNEVVHK
jgi:hypothetical protein